MLFRSIGNVTGEVFICLKSQWCALQCEHNTTIFPKSTMGAVPHKGDDRLVVLTSELHVLVRDGIFVQSFSQDYFGLLLSYGNSFSAAVSHLHVHLEHSIFFLSVVEFSVLFVLWKELRKKKLSPII